MIESQVLTKIVVWIVGVWMPSAWIYDIKGCLSLTKEFLSFKSKLMMSYFFTTMYASLEKFPWMHPNSLRCFLDY